RGIVLRAGHHRLDRLCRPARVAEDAAEQRGGGVGGRGCCAEVVGPECRHVAVAALLAEELELEPAVRGQVGVIVGKWDDGHARSPVLSQGTESLVRTCPPLCGCASYAPVRRSGHHDGVVAGYEPSTRTEPAPSPGPSSSSARAAATATGSPSTSK